MKVLYTIGHSNHTAQYLLELLVSHGISAVADVRSVPASRYAPHFSGSALQRALRKFGIAYAFLGLELGARFRDPACFRNGLVQYELLAGEPRFEFGLARIRRGMVNYRVALLCAEKDPIACHRSILVGRALHTEGIPVQHILPDGALETQEALEGRLLIAHRLAEHDMFATYEEILGEAYRLQAASIAFEDETMSEDPQGPSN